MSLVETHRNAIDAVLGLLGSRGYGHDPFEFSRGEKVHVTAYHGNPLAVPYVNLEVHGSNYRVSESFGGGTGIPNPDEKEMVVCVSLINPPTPLFVFLTNEEARDRWGNENNRTWFYTGDDFSDPDGVDKIRTVGRKY